MWDGFNLRKFPRIPVSCQVIVCPENKKLRFTTKTKNLGLGGVCVYLPKALERMTSCTVHLKIDRRYKFLKCAGRVVWSVTTRDAKKKKIFDTGIEFLNCPSEMSEKIKHFITRFAPRGA